MKITRMHKALVAIGVVVVLACGLAACGKADPSSGVAATVNGVEIPEQKVTDEVEHVRSQSGLSDDEQWGKFLVQNDMTPESVRSTIIDRMTDQEVIRQGASELGIEVTSEEVQAEVDKFKENYTSDEKWNDALKSAGFTEDSYFESIEESMIEKKVGEHFEEQAEVTDEDYVQSAQTYASYYDGAKNVSQIKVAVDDLSDEEAMEAARAQVQEAHDQVSSGKMTFAEAAAQYSSDESAKENGGALGWDKLGAFSEDITNALTDLEVGKVSDVIEGDGGVFILMVTETYDAPDDATTITSLDQIPAGFQENIKEMAVSVKANTLYTDWLDEMKENADIVVNDMPEGLPYDIDLTPYEKEKEAEDAAADADSSTTDDAAAADAAADASLADDAAADASLADDDAATADAEAASTDEAAAAAADATAADATATTGETASGTSASTE